MSAAKQRLNLFNFEFNYPFERHSPLWAGTRPAPTLSLTAIVLPLFEICYSSHQRYTVIVFVKGGTTVSINAAGKEIAESLAKQILAQIE
jgi:hypothetical protein